MSTLLSSRWAPKSVEAEESTLSSKTNEAHEPTPSSIQEPSSTIDRNNAASTLSAVATEFSPIPTEQQEAQHDGFAQTGAQQDELFNDIITESMQTRGEDDLFGDDFIPAEEPIIEHIASVETASAPAPASASASVSAPAPAPDSAQPRLESRRGRGRGRGGARSMQKETEPVIESTQAPENAPTGPKKEPAVRGDRFATGGLKKPKLSEAELAEKMAQISIKNASLAAAHARAEADAASFEQREAQAKVDASKKGEEAKQRAKEERRDRQQMIGEREKNRLRKLKAMEGREWDAEKDENDFTKGGRFDKKDSFAGDQADYSDGREYLLKEPQGNGSKGGRGGRGGKIEAIPRREDFPALPSSTSNITKASDTTGKSWADQVESSTASPSV